MLISILKNKIKVSYQYFINLKKLYSHLYYFFVEADLILFSIAVLCFRLDSSSSFLEEEAALESTQKNICPCFMNNDLEGFMEEISADSTSNIWILFIFLIYFNSYLKIKIFRF
eukprot:TRINITY_DN2001_c4_g1_i2.p1 TRINITY_DN2001_c4_g1~~TRINITY_DN2001_c4_g1_i2.p1  ORF type:complete len:114 (+),score=8.75 TRINITY_DN2001_c4_g1_i2:155-496(+)